MLDTLLHLATILLLLGVANGTPIFAKKIFGSRFNAPLDAGLKFLDGRPLLGPSKTVRGLLLSILCTSLAAPLLGVAWITGAGLAAASMLGDLASSFVKRRLNLRVHSRALGLDQIPESLLPLVLLQDQFGLNGGEIAGIIVVFFILELLLSRLLFRLHIRDRPY